MSTFNGERLKQVRLYRGLTIKDLAEMVKVSKQAISQYEKGIVTPKADKMMNIVAELKFPRKFYYEDTSELKHGEVFFRSKLSATKRDQYTMIETIDFVSKIYHFLEKYISFPSFDLLSNDDEITEKLNVEELTTALRNHWGIDEKPIKNMVNLLETRGVITAEFNNDKLAIDAFSTTLYDKVNKEERLLIVLGNDKPAAVRRNFNVAHELGHYYYDEGHVELDSLSKDEKRDMENRAHEFAGALLLPRAAFVDDIKHDPSNLKTYEGIKMKWHVSIAAMVVRAYKLNVIDNREYQNLMRYINRNGWRKSEPFDETIKRAKPYLLPHSIELLLDEKNDMFTKRSFMQALSDFGMTIPSDEIEYLLNLDEGTLLFEDVTDNVIKLEIL